MERTRGDAERELLKASKENNVDIGTYHGGYIVGNHYVYMASNGNNITESIMKVIYLRVKDVANRKHLKDICDQMKYMFNLWYEL